MTNQKGQSLIELLVALAIFVLMVSSVAFLILDAYISDRAGREKTQATFLAEEGLEAAKSIRDTNWSALLDGEHGLAISGNNWVFEDTPEAKDVREHLREGERKIIVEEIDSERKKITSQITWELTEARPQNVELVSYLTNWQRGGCQGSPVPCSDFLSEVPCEQQDGCSWQTAHCSGSCSCAGLGIPQCNKCPSCNLKFKPGEGLICVGTCNCSGLEQTQCGYCLCSWEPAQCFGTSAPCQNFTDEETCLSQEGCEWEDY